MGDLVKIGEKHHWELDYKVLQSDISIWFIKLPDPSKEDNVEIWKNHRKIISFVSMVIVVWTKDFKATSEVSAQLGYNLSFDKFQQVTKSAKLFQEALHWGMNEHALPLLAFIVNIAQSPDKIIIVR